MRTIGIAKESDFGEILSVLSSSCFAAKLPEPNDLLQSIPEYLSAERILVSKEHGRILAFAIVEPDVATLLFPLSHSFSKTTEVLESIGRPEGNVVGLYGIYVDGTLLHQGIGKELISAALARYKGYGWVTFVEGENPDAIRFFKGRGFVFLPGDHHLEMSGNGTVWAKPNLPKGICREGYW
ncbi:MAG: GNAT family N-acetyltransferase [Bacilli bacterium]|nr:GNAT family N-acetyltransferase [Bacilli bacterium]